MNKKILTIMLVLAALGFTIPVEAAVTHHTDAATCGTDGYDVCVNFTGVDYAHMLVDPGWTYAMSIDHIRQVYPGPGVAESLISRVAYRGAIDYVAVYNGNWWAKISDEVLAHIADGQGDIHFSQYFITKSCQLAGNCRTTPWVDPDPMVISAGNIYNDCGDCREPLGGWVINHVTVNNTNPAPHEFLVVTSGVNELGYPLSSTAVVTLPANTAMQVSTYQTIPYDVRLRGSYNMYSAVYPYDDEIIHPELILGSFSGPKVVTIY